MKLRKHPLDRLNHFQNLILAVFICLIVAVLIYAGIMGIIANV